MKILNRKAKFNYQLFDRFEAGIALTGKEVKAIKSGSLDLSAAYVKIIQGEAYLINASMGKDTADSFDARKTRKLLLHKGEIVSLQTKMKAKKLTLVPVKVYTKGRIIKIEIALAKAKRKYQKKELKKKKDIEREIERELKN